MLRAVPSSFFLPHFLISINIEEMREEAKKMKGITTYP